MQINELKKNLEEELKIYPPKNDMYNPKDCPP